MFWTVFWPTFAAFVGAYVVQELYQMALSYYLHRKQVAQRAEFEKKVANGEISPTEMGMMFNGGGMGSGPGMGNFPPGFSPTDSSENAPENEDYGQYL